MEERCPVLVAASRLENTLEYLETAVRMNTLFYANGLVPSLARRVGAAPLWTTGVSGHNALRTSRFWLHGVDFVAVLHSSAPLFEQLLNLSLAEQSPHYRAMLRPRDRLRSATVLDVAWLEGRFPQSEEMSLLADTLAAMPRGKGRGEVAGQWTAPIRLAERLKRFTRAGSWHCACPRPSWRSAASTISTTGASSP